MTIPSAILALVTLLIPPSAVPGLDYTQLASIAWGIEGEVTYHPGDYYGPQSINAAYIAGCTIVNRASSPYFPSTPHAVVTQPHQFNPHKQITSVSRASVHIALDVYTYPDYHCNGELFVYSRADLASLNWLLRRYAAISTAETGNWGIYGFDRYPGDIPLSEIIASLDVGLEP